MATCFGRPCDHHQANFYRSCAFNVLTIWDPIMCTTIFIYGLKSLLKVFTVRYKKLLYVSYYASKSTVILVHMYKNSIYLTVKTFNSDFNPYIKNDVHIMGSHIVSIL